MSELFPDVDGDTRQRMGWLDMIDGRSYSIGHINLYECQRCKAWVADRAGHTAWHRSVDTA